MNTAAQVVRGAPIAALSHPLLPLSRYHAPTSLFQKDCLSSVLLSTADPPDGLLDCPRDRNAHASTLITSQLPVEHWHENIGDPTIADAIMDRLIHNAHRIRLKGGSMRKKLKGDLLVSP
jgi:hypothetical protein